MSVCLHRSSAAPLACLRVNCTDTYRAATALHLCAPLQASTVPPSGQGAASGYSTSSGAAPPWSTLDSPTGLEGGSQGRGEAGQAGVLHVPTTGFQVCVYLDSKKCAQLAFLDS